MNRITSILQAKMSDHVLTALAAELEFRIFDVSLSTSPVPTKVGVVNTSASLINDP